MTAARPCRALPLVAVILALLSVGDAHADTPITDLPPDLAGLFEQAELAYREGRFAEAEGMYAQINRARPGFDRAWRRRCGTLLEQERVYDALEMCDRAVKITPSKENRTGLAIALTQPPLTATRGPRPELDQARQILDGVLADHPDYLPASQALCSWAVESGRFAALDRCVPALEAATPGHKSTLYFKTLQLIAKGELDEATRTLKAARAVGLSDPLVQRLVVQLAAAGRTLDPQRSSRIRTLSEAPEPMQWSDLIPWAILTLLVTSVAVAVFLGAGADDETGS